MSDSESDFQDVPNEPSAMENEAGASVTVDSSVDRHIAAHNIPIIVAIGASAGGLEALESFFRNMPSNAELAFVVIQHLDPHYPSILPTLLQKYTDMPVKQAANDVLIEANTVYVIAPNTMLALFNGALQVLGPTENMRIRLTIDYFLRSMARDVKDRCVAVILSGAGSDGELGLKAVKEAGGMSMVQDPLSAAYDGMPRSAIGTGMVDYILSPSAMPSQLIHYLRLAPSTYKPPLTIRRPEQMSDSIQHILLMIRTETGHDFSRYKQSTIRRRIERLMAVNQIETIEEYVHFLQNNTIGVETLFRDLLIGVTNFFRDKEVFETLRQTVIPQLFHNQRLDEPIRIWVPACSTGEEAYSLAILLREHMNVLGQDYRVQIFATDIDTQAVNTARLGAYASNIEMDIPEVYLKQYFVRLPEGGYQVVKSLREMLVFAPHSVIKDPPFSKLHLISCRNLLIYLNSELQDQVLSYFHFALLPMGMLVLGSSESLGRQEEQFAVIESQHKIFQRTPGLSKARFKSEIPFMIPHLEREPVNTPVPATNLKSIAESVLLNKWTPPCVIINNQGHMRYVHGQTEKYLLIYPGELDQLDIVRSARESLRLPLKSAIYRAVTQQREIYEPNIAVQIDDHQYHVNLTVTPLSQTTGHESLLAIFFEEVKEVHISEMTSEELQGTPEDQRDPNYQQIQQELSDTRAYLQATIEELRSSNEEMQSINEELQSVNEELETSQEELKAVNEELLTINAELEEKVEEVTWANNDLSNTLNALQTGIILLDSEFNIRRFNPAATQVFKLIPGDIGRPIMHVVSDFDYPTLINDVQRVFDTLMPHEIDIQTKDGRWYALQIRPYRTLQNAIKGVVIYFNDVTARK